MTLQAPLGVVEDERRLTQLETPYHDLDLKELERRALEVYNYDLYRDDPGMFAVRRQFVEDYLTDIKPMDRRVRSPLGTRPLRVGYLGSDFRAWSGNWIFGPVILGHTAQVIPYVYSYAKVPYNPLDTITRMYRERTIWRDVVDLNVQDAARLIDEDKIDILVDLMGYSYGLPLQILALKPAPIQITAWGHVSGGTGLKTVDYLFADPVACPPEIRHYYTETIVDLPCVVRYTKPPYMPPCGRTTDRPFRFGMLHRFTKVTERAVAAWVEILHRVPDAELFIKSVDIEPTEDQKQRICSRLREMGDDVAHRIRIASVSTHLEHLKTFWDVDVMLDTFPFNGGVVSLESLAMGVPFITRAGKYLASRVGASILHQLGMDEWATESDTSYINQAVRAYERREQFHDRASLLEQMLRSPLCDGPAYVAAVEQHYQYMAHGDRR